LCAFAALFFVETLHAQGTAFTYQGQLNDGGGLAKGGGIEIQAGTVTITMTVPMKLLAPIGFLANLFPSTGYTLVSTSTFKNEPFSPTTTD